MIGHLAINPDPYRVRAQAILDSPEMLLTPREKALAEVAILMCDRYDELRAVFGVEPGTLYHCATWPGGAETKEET